jgi:hypothetical protein
MSGVEIQDLTHVLEGESGDLALCLADSVAAVARDPRLRLVEEPLLPLVRGWALS